MVKKDWKKVKGKLMWKKWGKGGILIKESAYIDPKEKRYKVLEVFSQYSRGYVLHTTKTKIQALKFAKSYMKTH